DDDVGPTVATKLRGTGYTRREDPSAQIIPAVAITAGLVGAAAGGAGGALALCSEGRRKAAAERGGVGKQDWLVEALLVRREEVVPVVAAADEGVERLRLTGRDARPGHIARVDVGEGAVGAVQAAAEVRIDVKVTDQRPVSGV